MRPAHWVPPVAWMALILLFSTDVGASQHTGDVLRPLLDLIAPGLTSSQVQAVHVLVRKGAHVTVYAVLAALWTRALVGGWRWPAARAAGAAVGISLLWALLDEAHQALTATRTGALGDVTLDLAGAIAGALATAVGWRRVADRAAGVALWVAAVGGVLVLLVDAVTGVPGGALWITVPVAALALLLRHRHRPAARRSSLAPEPPGPAAPRAGDARRRTTP
jgi:VanZ family protein